MLTLNNMMLKLNNWNKVCLIECNKVWLKKYVSVFFSEAVKAREALEELRTQYDSSIKQYDELNGEHRKLQVNNFLQSLIRLFPCLFF